MNQDSQATSNLLKSLFIGITFGVIEAWISGRSFDEACIFTLAITAAFMGLGVLLGVIIALTTWLFDCVKSGVNERNESINVDFDMDDFESGTGER